MDIKEAINKAALDERARVLGITKEAERMAEAGIPEFASDVDVCSRVLTYCAFIADSVLSGANYPSKICRENLTAEVVSE